MSTQLAFRTVVGGANIPAGETILLGTVDVSPFSRIRVVALERVGSTTGLNIRLVITEGQGELVTPLDTLHLSPHSQMTRVYDVPGTRLSILADAVGGAGADSFDVLLYGNG